MDRFYNSDDMVRAASAGCEGCGKCCRGMGESIRLDPYDVDRLQKNLHKSFQELINSCIGFHVEKGMIIPHLLMDAKDQCSFLDGEGRCEIHGFRPGICRLFPLGRDYDGEKFRYFVVEGGCPEKNRSKVKISRWLDIPDLAEYEKYICSWHYFVKDMQAALMETDEESRSQANLFLLQSFYSQPYGEGKFYEEFGERLSRIRGMFL